MTGTGDRHQMESVIGFAGIRILNVLARLLEPALPAPIDTPGHLALEAEPVANVSRYDGLREVDHAS